MFQKISIDVVSRDERLLLGHTAALSKDQYEKIQEILKEAINKIENVDETTQTETEVYQIEVAAFPLTKKSSAGSGNVG